MDVSAVTQTYPDGYWLPAGTLPPEPGAVQYDWAELDRKRGTPEYHQVLPIKGADWRGRRQWGIRLGPASCHGSGAAVFHAENVRLPSGERGDALAIDGGTPRPWRRPDGDGRLSDDRRNKLDVTWTWGVVEFFQDDAVFTDRPSLQPPHLDNYLVHEAELARDILGNHAMCALVKDIAGVAAMWMLTLNGKWTHAGASRPQHFTSHDDMSNIIADMRGRGEHYSDIIWLDLPFGETAVHEREQALQQMLTDMGWSPVRDSRDAAAPRPARYYTTDE